MTDDDELKEAEQDDYIPLIRRTVGGQRYRSRNTHLHHSTFHRYNHATARCKHDTSMRSTPVHVSSASSSYVLLTHLLASPPQPPLHSLTQPPPLPHSGAATAAPSSAPVAHVAVFILSPSLSSSVASSSFALSPVGVWKRVSTTGSRVVYGGSVMLQQQRRSTSSRDGSELRVK